MKIMLGKKIRKKLKGKLCIFDYIICVCGEPVGDKICEAADPDLYAKLGSKEEEDKEGYVCKNKISDGSTCNIMFSKSELAEYLNS